MLNTLGERFYLFGQAEYGEGGVTGANKRREKTLTPKYKLTKLFFGNNTHAKVSARSGCRIQLLPIAANKADSLAVSTGFTM